MIKKQLLLIALIFQSFISFSQLCSTNSLETRSIKASETDNNITPELHEHQVYFNPDCIPNGKLLIHLVGTIDNPASTTYFPTLAANNGFKVISLKYRNNVAALTACGNSSDIDCFWKYRNEIIFGNDTSPAIDVDTHNSIINRIEKLLIHLHNNYPSESWDSFLTTSNNVDWTNLILSGHSQGGGHAAFLGKLYAVNRVLMFASPNDFSSFFSAPATWINSPSETPDSSYYAFGNLWDDVSDFENQYQVWSGLNLLTQGDSINVDNEICPFNNSKILYTKDNSSTVFSGNHNAVVIDNFTPLESGIPVFTSVWKYMLGICEETTSISNADVADSKIKIFPNPTRDNLFFESEKVISQVDVFSISGKLLEVIYPNRNNFEVNLESYQGLLILKILTKDWEGKVARVSIIK